MQIVNSQVSDVTVIALSGSLDAASVADFDAEYTRRQAEIFLRIARKYGAPGMLIHIHNSAAMRYLPIVPPLNAVRMGLIQYGINPFPDNAGFDNLNIMPVLSFKSRVLAVSRGARSRRCRRTSQWRWFRAGGCRKIRRRFTTLWWPPTAGLRAWRGAP